MPTRIDDATLVSLPILWAVLIGTAPVAVSLLFVGFKWGSRLSSVEKDVRKLKRYSWTIPMQKLWAAQVMSKNHNVTVDRNKITINVPDPIKDVVEIMESDKLPSDT